MKTPNQLPDTFSDEYLDTIDENNIENAENDLENYLDDIETFFRDDFENDIIEDEL